jgi:hypothetical protein
VRDVPIEQLRARLRRPVAGTLRIVLGARPKARATGLIFSPPRRQRSRMVSQVSVLITPGAPLSP